MKSLILSYFHQEFGPKLFFQIPDLQEQDILDNVPSLMDLYSTGFFIHTFGSFKCANYLFEIPSSYARGNRELLLLSVLMDIKDKINYDFTQELLESFSREILKIPDIFKAFYLESEKWEGDKTKNDKLWELFFTFHKSFPEENVIIKKKEVRILVFGLAQAGKTTIINALRNKPLKTLPTVSIDVSRIFVEDLSLIAYDTPGQRKYWNLWDPYLKNQDGLVFVLDVHDKENYKIAKRILYKISTDEKVRDLPLLILINKIDLEKPELSDIQEEMDFESLKIENRKVKGFLTSAVTNEGIFDSFRWLAKELSKKTPIKPDIEIGLIFSKWDDDLGPEILSYYPIERIEDPELLVIKSFSIAQFVFSGKDFRRASVILPYPYYNAKVAIYFDYIVNLTMRGGIQPISLILIYDEKIPSAIINQFNIFIFDEINSIKERPLDKEELYSRMSFLHKKIQKKLKAFKKTVEALRIAELRYQSLFRAARDAIIIIDTKSGIILDANESAEKLLLLPQEEIVGMHSSQIKLGDSKVDFKYIILKQLLSNIPLSVEIKNNNGVNIPVEINANEISLGSQNLIQCIIRDITNRVKSEKELRKSEQKFRQLFQDTPNAILLMNMKGQLIDCNEAMEKLTGYEREELLGRKYAKQHLIPLKYMKTFYDKLRDYLRGEKLHAKEIELIRKDDKKVWVNAQINLVQIDDLKLIQVLAYDISQQKKAEEIIKKNLKFERSYSKISLGFLLYKDFERAIYDSMKEIGLSTDSSISFILLIDLKEKRFNKSFNWFSVEFKGINKDIERFDFPIDDWLLDNLDEYPSKFISFNDINNIPSSAIKLKERLLELNLSSLLIHPIKIEGELLGVVGLAKTATRDLWKDYDNLLLGMYSQVLGPNIQKNKADIALKQNQEKLNDAYERINYYKDIFTLDINNVFKQINQNVNHTLYQGEYVKHDLDKIKQLSIEGQYMVSSIEKLTVLDSIEIPIKDVDIYEILGKAISGITTNFDNIQISLNVIPNERNVKVKANDILKDVFENLIVNIIKYNPDSLVNVEITTSRLKEDEKCYIKTEFVDKTFQEASEYSELKNEGELDEVSSIRGTLLGLSLVEKFISGLNGSIWVENNNFVILIPQAEN